MRDPLPPRRLQVLRRAAQGAVLLRQPGALGRLQEAQQGVRDALPGEQEAEEVRRDVEDDRLQRQEEE